MPERIIELDEDKINKIAASDFLWDATACDLEGDDLGVHEYLKIRVTTDSDGEVSAWTVIDCDRKDEPQ